MTVRELIDELQKMPQNAIVTRRGYEGGVDEVTKVIPPRRLYLHVHDDWYYGDHEYARNDDPDEERAMEEHAHIQAVHLD